MDKKVKRRVWDLFKKHHYLDSKLNVAANCFVYVYNDQIIAFIGVLHHPHPTDPRMKRVHRLVVLPDYQGIGIGKSLLYEVGKIFQKEGFNYYIRTSLRNLIYSLKNEKDWILIHKGRAKYKVGPINMVKTSSFNRNTYNFKLK